MLVSVFEFRISKFYFYCSFGFTSGLEFVPSASKNCGCAFACGKSGGGTAGGAVGFTTCGGGCCNGSDCLGCSSFSGSGACSAGFSSAGAADCSLASVIA